jgi:O-antigen/teichoic acid export membrane protein
MNASPPSRQTYPLSLLLVIVTGCAVLAAVLGPAVRNFRWDDWFDHLAYLAIAIIACLLVGALLGVFIGLHQYRRWTGVLSGAWIGAVIGLLAGFLMTIDRENLAMVVQAVVIGCVLLVATAWLVRPPLPEKREGNSMEATEAPRE